MYQGTLLPSSRLQEARLDAAVTSRFSVALCRAKALHFVPPKSNTWIDDVNEELDSSLVAMKNFAEKSTSYYSTAMPINESSAFDFVNRQDVNKGYEGELYAGIKRSSLSSVSSSVDRMQQQQQQQPQYLPAQEPPSPIPQQQQQQQPQQQQPIRAPSPPLTQASVNGQSYDDERLFSRDDATASALLLERLAHYRERQLLHDPYISRYTQEYAPPPPPPPPPPPSFPPASSYFFNHAPVDYSMMSYQPYPPQTLMPMSPPWFTTNNNPPPPPLPSQMFAPNEFQQQPLFRSMPQVIHYPLSQRESFY